jgi:hypothetical protein
VDEEEWSVSVFHGSGQKPLVPVKGNLNATLYNDILDNSVLPNFWQHFGEGPFLLQHDNTPVHKVRLDYPGHAGSEKPEMVCRDLVGKT